MGAIRKYLIGTYTEPVLFGTGQIMEGKGKGIHVLKLDLEQGTLAVEPAAGIVRNPSYVAVSGEFVYCVNELKQYNGQMGGSVTVLTWDAPHEKLQIRQVLPTHGEDPCHVAVDETGTYLVAANFMTGSVCCWRIGPDGLLTETDFVQHEGCSADPVRQAGPHAHAGIWFGGGRNGADRQVLVPDLGKDELAAYRVTAEGKLHYEEAVSVRCRKGNGPRFGEFHTVHSVLYLVNELASSVTVLAYDSSGPAFTVLQEISTLPEGVENPSTAADLHISPDGRHVYASNRGLDSIAVFSVLDDGRLKAVEQVPCGGKTPRNFVIDPDGGYVLVANQDSDTIALFARDPRTGRLTWLQTVDAPSPVCLIPCRQESAGI